MLKIKGLKPELQEILNADMSHVQERRRAREAFKDIQLNIDHLLFKVIIIWNMMFFFSKTVVGFFVGCIY